VQTNSTAKPKKQKIFFRLPLLHKLFAVGTALVEKYGNFWWTRYLKKRLHTFRPIYSHIPTIFTTLTSISLVFSLLFVSILLKSPLFLLLLYRSRVSVIYCYYAFCFVIFTPLPYTNNHSKCDEVKDTNNKYQMIYKVMKYIQEIIDIYDRFLRIPPIPSLISANWFTFGQTWASS
jgi:hypothetical protein